MAELNTAERQREAVQQKLIFPALDQFGDKLTRQLVQMNFQLAFSHWAILIVELHNRAVCCGLLLHNIWS